MQKIKFEVLTNPCLKFRERKFLDVLIHLLSKWQLDFVGLISKKIAAVWHVLFALAPGQYRDRLKI